jgi:hypothetical protein
MKTLINSLLGEMRAAFLAVLLLRPESLSSTQDLKSGAGQYFTGRALIQGIVHYIAPKASETVCNPKQHRRVPAFIADRARAAGALCRIPC